MKTKLEAYFKKFRLSPDMKRISRVILNNDHLDRYAYDFKISAKNCNEFMKNCAFSIGGKEFYKEKRDLKEKRRALLENNITLISQILNLDRKFSGILESIRLFKGDIVYGVIDAGTIGFKVYFVLSEDLKNNSTLISKLCSLYVHCLGDFCLNRKNIMIVLEFKKDLNSFGIYEQFDDIKAINFKGNDIAKELFSKLNIEKEAFYYAKKNFSLSGKSLYSKVYKVYNMQRIKRSVVKTRQEADIFMGDDFRKVVNKNFKNCDFSVLGYNLQSGNKDVYILPR